MTNDFPDVAFTLSAPGKVILFGEHAVVYHKKAIAASLQLRTTLHVVRTLSSGETCPQPLTLHLTHHDPLHLSTSDLTRPITRPITSHSTQDMSTTITNLLIAIFHQFPTLSPSSLTGLKFTLTSELPMASGLGSSAAVAVLFAGCMCMLDTYNGFPPVDGWSQGDLDTINAAAFEGEKLIHGPGASGMDNTIVTFGGLVEYQKGSPPTFLTPSSSSSPSPSLGNTNASQDMIPFSSLQWLIWDSGVAKNTAVQIGKVKEMYDMIPNVVNGIMDTIEGIVNTFSKTYSHEGMICVKELEMLIRVNHSLLKTLNVSHPIIDTKLARDDLPSATKITGGGGGGCTLSLLAPESSIFYEKARTSNDLHVVTLGGPGLQVSEMTRDACLNLG